MRCPARAHIAYAVWLHTQDGFGWTNGVTLWLLERYAQSFARELREDGEHGDLANQ